MNTSWSSFNSSALHPNASLPPYSSSNQSLPGGFLPRDSIIVWAIVTSLITAIGVVACITVAAVILKANGERNSGSNLLIINYLLMHLIVCGINTPIVIYLVTQRNVNRVNPPNICPAVQFLSFSIDEGIDWTNLGLAIHRIIALRFPTKYYIVTKRSVIWSIIATTWIVAVPTNIPYFFGVGGYFAPIPGGRCGVRINNPRIVAILTAVGSYLPFGLSVVSSIFLLATVLKIKWANRFQVQPTNSAVGVPRPTRTMDRRVRLAQTLLGATLFDAICAKTWTLLGSTYPVIFQRYPMASVWARTSVTLASSLAPIVICLLNSDYRKRLLQCASSTARQPSVMRRSVKSVDGTE